MSKLQISEVHVIETDLYERMAEDGRIHCFDLFVRVICDGAVYDHEHVFHGAVKDEYEGYYHVNYNAKADAERLANRIAEVSFINTDHWNGIGHVDEIFKTEQERVEEGWSDYMDSMENEYKRVPYPIKIK